MWIIASDKRNGNEQEQLSLIVAKEINHIGFNAKGKKGKELQRSASDYSSYTNMF